MGQTGQAEDFFLNMDGKPGCKIDESSKDRPVETSNVRFCTSGPSIYVTCLFSAGRVVQSNRHGLRPSVTLDQFSELTILLFLASGSSYRFLARSISVLSNGFSPLNSVSGLKSVIFLISILNLVKFQFWVTV